MNGVDRGGSLGNLKTVLIDGPRDGRDIVLSDGAIQKTDRLDGLANGVGSRIQSGNRSVMVNHQHFQANHGLGPDLLIGRPFRGKGYF